MSRRGSLVRNTAILSFGSIVPKLASIVTLPILTGILSKADYGMYDLVLSMVTLVLPVATLQLQAAAFRFLIEARDNAGRQRAIVSNIVVVSSVMSIAALAVTMVLLRSLTLGTRLLICLYYLLDIIVTTLRQVARGLSKNGLYSASVIANSAFECVAVVGLVMAMGLGLNGALIASAIGQAASLAMLMIGLRVWSLVSLGDLSLSLTRELISYSWPLIPNSLSSWAISMSDRLVLTMMIGIEASAIYAAASKIPHMLGLFQNAFTLAWQESASLTKDDEDRDRYYSSTFDMVFCILAGGLALLIAASPVLFALLIKGDYQESYVQMNILFLGSMASCISAFLGGVYIAHMRTKEIGITTAAVAALNLLFEVLFVPLIGIYAASFAYTLSYALLAIYRGVRLRSFQPIAFKRRKIALTVSALVAMVAIGTRRMLSLMILNALVAILLFVSLNKDVISAVVRRLRKRRYV